MENNQFIPRLKHVGFLGFNSVSEVTSIIDKNDNIKEYIVRFEIIYNDGVSYRKFDKLTDELYLRFELKLKLSEIGLLENLEK